MGSMAIVILVAIIINLVFPRTRAHGRCQSPLKRGGCALAKTMHVHTYNIVILEYHIADMEIMI